MKFRYARHTNNLEKLKSFYTNVLGLELLGEFKNHNGYNGIFLGFPNADWHLEFTQTKENTIHTFDEDDILVFSPKSKIEYDTLIERFCAHKISFIEPKNPYWIENGKLILDPDGYCIAISNFNS